MSLYCTCRLGKTPGYTNQEESDLWVHSVCMKPSRMVFEKVTDMRVPHGATAVLKSLGRSDGIFETTFATQDGKVTTLNFHPYPRKVDMNQGRDLLLKTWQLLDEATVGAMDVEASTQVQDHHKAQARAYANVLALFMEPFFTTPDDIVREAVVRYKARQSGETHVTPGLAEEVWNPNKNWDGTDRVQFSSETPRKSNFKTKESHRTLTPDEVTAVKNALNSGAFTSAQLADMFKTSVAVIENCR